MNIPAGREPVLKFLGQLKTLQMTETNIDTVLRIYAITFLFQKM